MIAKVKSPRIAFDTNTSFEAGEEILREYKERTGLTNDFIFATDLPKTYDVLSAYSVEQAAKNKLKSASKTDVEKNRKSMERGPTLEV